MAKKMDRKLVSKQAHEIKHVARKTKKSADTVRAAQAKPGGRSRKRLMAELSK